MSADLNQKHGSDVIMYTTAWRGYCKKARILHSKKGIESKDLNIEKSAEANTEMKSLGGHGVPVFLIKGEVVKGFNQS